MLSKYLQYTIALQQTDELSKASENSITDKISAGDI